MILGKRGRPTKLDEPVTRTYNLERQTVDIIERIADEYDRSMSEVVRDAVRTYDEEQRDEVVSALRDRVAALRRENEKLLEAANRSGGIVDDIETISEHLDQGGVPVNGLSSEELDDLAVLRKNPDRFQPIVEAYVDADASDGHPFDQETMPLDIQRGKASVPSVVLDAKNALGSWEAVMALLEGD